MDTWTTFPQISGRHELKKEITFLNIRPGPGNFSQGPKSWMRKVISLDWKSGYRRCSFNSDSGLRLSDFITSVSLENSQLILSREDFPGGSVGKEFA